MGKNGFKNWDLNALSGLRAKGMIVDDLPEENRKKKKRAMIKNAGREIKEEMTADEYRKEVEKTEEDIIAECLEKEGYRVVREHAFHENRNYKFDVAIPDLKIAIEYEGGIYSGGRHVRGKGFAEDCRKYNAALIRGWKVLRYSTDTKMKSNWLKVIINDIKELLRGKNESSN